MGPLIYERAVTLFTYDPLSGILSNRIHRKGIRSSGTGTVNNAGYLTVCVDYKKYLVHRIAWLLHFHGWPVGQIDHINGVRTDNRIDNLREATQLINMRNSRAKPSNKSGVPGVRFHQGKWSGQVRANGKQIHVGTFRTKEEAVQAVAEFRNQHGYTNRHTAGG